MNIDLGDSGASDEFVELLRNYDRWRKIANSLDIGPYDEPDWEDGRLYFRVDYSEKSRKWPDWREKGYWAAWIIAPRTEGYVCVSHSLLHERDAQRSERIEVMFSHYADAGKFVIFQVGNSVRYGLGLETLFIKWEARGLNSHIRIEPADRQALDFLVKERPTLKRDFAENHLKRYTLEVDPSSYGFALPAQQVNMEVLALSFEELTSALLDGMPESITSQVALWRQ